MAGGQPATLNRSSGSAPGPLVVRRVRAPLQRPHRSAHGVEHHREVLLVEQVVVGGPSGWGECPTLSSGGYVTETTEEAWAAFRSGSPLGPAASAAVADARLDALLRSRQEGLADHLGATRGSVPRCGVIADVGGEPGAAADRAGDLLAAGAAMVKVKIAPGSDAEVLRAVIDRVGDPALVAADANGSYADVASLGTVDGLGLRYLEQPFDHRYGLVALAAMHRRLSTPVALDESISSVDDARDAVGLRAAAVLSLKPARMGGVLDAWKAAQLAVVAGVELFVGGMLELGIGRATALALAAIDACGLPTDLGPSSAYVGADLCAPVVVDSVGELVVPHGPGCGRSPDPDRLEEMTVAEVTVAEP